MATINYRRHDPWPPSGVVTSPKWTPLCGPRIYGNLFKPAEPSPIESVRLADNICHALSNYTHADAFSFRLRRPLSR